MKTGSLWNMWQRAGEPLGTWWGLSRFSSVLFVFKNKDDPIIWGLSHEFHFSVSGQRVQGRSERPVHAFAQIPSIPSVWHGMVPYSGVTCLNPVTYMNLQINVTLASLSIVRWGGSQLSVHPMGWSFLFIDRNDLHCYQLPTIYRVVNQLKDNKRCKPHRSEFLKGMFQTAYRFPLKINCNLSFYLGLFHSLSHTQLKSMKMIKKNRTNCFRVFIVWYQSTLWGLIWCRIGTWLWRACLGSGKVVLGLGGTSALLGYVLRVGFTKKRGLLFHHEIKRPSE